MACADRADPAHVACTAARDGTLEAGRILITTDFVVDETLTLIRFRLACCPRLGLEERASRGALDWYAGVAELVRRPCECRNEKRREPTRISN